MVINDKVRLFEPRVIKVVYGCFSEQSCGGSMVVGDKVHGG